MHLKQAKLVLIALALCLFTEGQLLIKDSVRKEILKLAASDLSPDKELRGLRNLYDLLKTANATHDSVTALLFHRMGLAYYSKGSYDSAVIYTNAEINLKDAGNKTVLSDPAQKIKSYYNLSVFYDSLGLINKKNDAIDSCISIGLASGRQGELLLTAISEKMHWLMNIGDYSRCLQYAETGQNASIKAGLPYSDYALRIFSLKINALLLLKKYPEIPIALRGKIEAYKKAGRSDYGGNLYQLWANYYLGMGKLDSVLYYNGQSFALNLERKQLDNCASSLNSSGYIFYSYLRQDNQALENYFRALHYANDQEAVSINNNIANVYARQKKFELANSYYQKAFDRIGPGLNEFSLLKDSAGHLNDRLSEYIVSLVLDKADAALSQYKTGDGKVKLDSTLLIFQRADQLIDVMRHKQFEVSSKLFWRNSIRRLYEHAIEACWLGHNTRQGFYFFEKSRAVLLDDELRNNAAYHLKAQMAEEINVQEMKKAILSDHMSVFELFDGDSSVFTLQITSGGEEISRISKRDYDSLTNEYISIVSNREKLMRGFPEFLHTSHQLYVLLFNHLSPPRGRMVISPDGPFFPFESLVSSIASKSHFMLSDYSISYTYSARFLMAETTDQTAGAGDFFGVAPVHYESGTDLVSLPGSDLSLQHIGTDFNKRYILAGKSATKKEFLMHFSDYQMVQLYSHASYREGAGDPVIYFADSVMSLLELSNQRTPATRLVVLSACETALGKDYRGEGIFSFSRQFAAMGIPASVSNLWSVDNESTYRITELFYQQIAKGIPTDIALQQAKLRFLETASLEKTMPYFWASAILTGKPEVIALAPVFPAWTMYLFAGVVLSVLAISFLVKPSWFRNQKPRQ